MEAIEGIWNLLSAAGGTVALTFIVALAVGINALLIFFVGSAVVVLERFARVARSPGAALGSATVLVLLGAWLFVGQTMPELKTRPFAEWLPHFGTAAAALGALAALAMGLAWLALRLPPASLGRAALALLGLAGALFIGSAGNVVYAAAPPVAIVLFVALLRWRRVRRLAQGRDASRGVLERDLGWLAGALALAVPLALLLPVPNAEVALAGTSIVQLFFAGVLFGLAPLAAAGLVGSRRSVEWFIAVRYLVAKRRQVFISAITAICVGGIAAGVWLIVIVLSVMNGFEKTWRDEILGNRAHFTVHNGLGPFEGYDSVVEAIRNVPGVTGASPYLDAEGMVRGTDGEIFSVRVRGIDPTTVGDVTELRDDLVIGSLDQLNDPQLAQREELEPQSGDAPPGDPGIVIGHQLAGALGVTVGDPILLISPFGGPPTPLGPAPRLKRFVVAGVFKSSFFQYDEVYTYTSLPAAQDFRRAGDVIDGVEARTTDFYRSRLVGQAVREQLDYPFYTRDWKDIFPAFFQALKTERVMMFLLLTMIMVVAAFVIVATLVMMIMEKSSDIAILKAMGAEDSTIERIFAIEGTLIGLAGTALGVISGIAVTDQLSWIQARIEDLTGIDTLPASVYQFSTLPSDVDPVQISGVAAIAMILSLGATLLPSRQGARLDPAEALRYE